MASYMIFGKNNSGEQILSVQISQIGQETPAVAEQRVVDAMKNFMATVEGVTIVNALKYEQVISNV